MIVVYQINKNSIELAPNPGKKCYADLYVDDKSLLWNPEIDGIDLYYMIIDYFRNYKEAPIAQAAYHKTKREES